MTATPTTRSQYIIHLVEAFNKGEKIALGGATMGLLAHHVMQKHGIDFSHVKDAVKHHAQSVGDKVYDAIHNTRTTRSYHSGPGPGPEVHHGKVELTPEQAKRHPALAAF